jgi:hypothetical protein
MVPLLPGGEEEVVVSGLVKVLEIAVRLLGGENTLEPAQRFLLVT